jgi:very-short-patch-repair endonuclease
MKKIPEVIIDVSRRLRKEMTESEKKLWEELKAKKFKGTKFIRQSPVYVFTENS